MNKHELTRIFRSPPVLECRRLILRKIECRDYVDMYDYSRREDVTRYLLWSPHPSLSYTKGYIHTLQHHYKNGDFYDWAITVKEGGMIGTVGFTRLDFQNNCGEIGYVLNPRYHGRGYATEAASAILRFGFTRLGLNRIEAHYMAENLASRRVMEKLGMHYEGTLRQSMRVKGIYRDIGICAITRAEYVALQSRSRSENGMTPKTPPKGKERYE